jgi:hypothetical protein
MGISLSVIKSALIVLPTVTALHEEKSLNRQFAGSE